MITSSIELLTIQSSSLYLNLIHQLSWQLTLLHDEHYVVNMYICNTRRESTLLVSIKEEGVDWRYPLSGPTLIFIFITGCVHKFIGLLSYPLRSLAVYVSTLKICFYEYYIFADLLFTNHQKLSGLKKYLIGRIIVLKGQLFYDQGRSVCMDTSFR